MLSALFLCIKDGANVDSAMREMYNEVSYFHIYKGGKCMKLRKLLCVSAMMLTALVTAAGAVNASPSMDELRVNGSWADGGAVYKINGNNYYKLRDIAAYVDGTEKQFDVSWNAAEKRIDLTSGKAYTWVGGELGALFRGDKDAVPSNAVVYLNGKKTNFTGYNINGSTYYKLRDVCKNLNIGVYYFHDSGTHYIEIQTDADYGKENPGVLYRHTVSDVRQHGDSGIGWTNTGTSDGIALTHSYYYPSAGHYGRVYQDYLDNCGEEIVTVTVPYMIYCSNAKDGKFEKPIGSFYARIKTNTFVPLLADKTSNDQLTESHYSPSMYVQTVLIDESGQGTFDLKMPRSVYDYMMNGYGNGWEAHYDIFSMGFLSLDGKSYNGTYVTINGVKYSMGGASIDVTNLRSENQKPFKLFISLRGDNT